MLVNGVLSDSISAADRGLLYGDGVFRTLRVAGGQPQHWPRHYRKLQSDCGAIGLPCPEASLLREELHRLACGQPDGVAKIIITRGAGARGYAPPGNAAPTRIVSIAPFVPCPDEFYAQGVRLRVCALRLSRQPRLAGVKHLNRLENVLAAAEWDDAGIPEGLLLDPDGNVIEGTRSNLFLVQGGELLTPDLSHCGVAGVQRERVLELAAAHGMTCRTGNFGLADARAAGELFLVNSLIGLWPVRELQDRAWSHFPVARQMEAWLHAASA
jgi:4-amino-4-deoxychorismate lyase